MRIGWIVAALGLSASSNMPMSYAPQDPVQSVPERWQGLAKDGAGQADLLSSVPNTALEPWLDKALLGNPGLQQLILVLAEAGWSRRQIGAARLQEVSLSTDVTRHR